MSMNTPAPMGEKAQARRDAGDERDPADSRAPGGRSGDPVFLRSGCGAAPRVNVGDAPGTCQLPSAQLASPLARRRAVPKDPATVPRILLLHLACGCSLAETAARASASGLAQISAVGVFQRLRAARPWLLWLAQQMRGAADLPMKVLGRRLLAVDATAISEPGATAADWKVHYAVNVADLQCDFFELTDVQHGGETFRRVPVVAGGIMMGDRVYATWSMRRRCSGSLESRDITAI